MRLVVAVAASLLLLAVAAFCLFGFLATFEPTDRQGQFLAFRIGYGVIGVGCVAGIVALVVKAVRK
jgi:hypothetical protein